MVEGDNGQGAQDTTKNITKVDFTKILKEVDDKKQLEIENIKIENQRLFDEQKKKMKTLEDDILIKAEKLKEYEAEKIVSAKKEIINNAKLSDTQLNKLKHFYPDYSTLEESDLTGKIELIKENFKEMPKGQNNPVINSSLNGMTLDSKKYNNYGEMFVEMFNKKNKK